MTPPTESRPVYMDYQATTPVDPRVLDAMLPFFTRTYGNAASVDHVFGADAAAVVEVARCQIRASFETDRGDVIFTSGSTEANNLAIKGIADRYRDVGNHIITCQTEHSSVLDTCRHLSDQGWEVTYLPVDQHGVVDPDEVRRSITARTVLISIMMANNEVGTLAPIHDIGEIARDHGVLFHTDATQAVGCMRIAVEELGIDLMSLSAHKLYGPKGCGALYVRKRRPRIRLSPQIHGGGHEGGLRSGTLNVPSIVGMAKAVMIAGHERDGEAARLRSLRDRLLHNLLGGIDDLVLNGHPVQRLPHNLNIAIPGVENRSLLVQLKHDVALSTGSACASAGVEPSHVIRALSQGEERAHHSVRLSLGRYTTEEEVDYVAEKLTSAVRRLRALVGYAPLCGVG